MVIAELQRRRVLHVAGVYIVSALSVIYAADVILPRFNAPDWTVTLVIVIAGLGLIVTTGLAWAFDLTPTGLVRSSDMPQVAAPTVVLERPPADHRAIAVLPFEHMSSDPGTEFFGDGISEEIINALAQLPELRVVGRTSAFTFKGKREDLREIGRQLNVGTVLEGSVRRMGERVHSHRHTG